jgi:hypothetical protein
MLFFVYFYSCITFNINEIKIKISYVKNIIIKNKNLYFY